MLTHMIIEVFCTLRSGDDNPPAAPACCRDGAGKTGVHCVLAPCPHAAFTDAPRELAFSDANGGVDISDEANSVGFGGDMEPEGISEWARNQLQDLWQRISKKKIKEAHLEYMDQMKDICDVDDIFGEMRHRPHEIRMDQAHRVLLARGYRPEGREGSHRRYVDTRGGVVTVRDEDPLKPVYVKNILKAIYLKDIADRIEGGAKP